MQIMSTGALLLLVLCLLPGCGQPVLKDDVASEFASQNLYRVENSGFAEAFVRRDAALSSYRAVDFAPMDLGNIDIPNTVVSGTLRRDWEITPQRKTALQENWADATDRAFATYARATSGPGVLRITTALTRIAPGRPTVTTIGADIQPVSSSQDAVEISAEFRLFDADTGTLLAVIRDSRTITSVAMSRTAPIAVTMLLRSWAALLHTRVSGR